VVRISGDPGAADLLALAYLGMLTLSLHRGTELQAAARVASSCNRLHPSRGSSAAYSTRPMTV
jgi:hypothetical protein